jgi:hypothetical protein
MGVSGQRHALAALYAGERIPGTHYIGGWVGLRACLDTVARQKILCHCWGSNPGPQSVVFFFSVPVCAITASGVPGGTLVFMNRFSTLCG